MGDSSCRSPEKGMSVCSPVSVFGFCLNLKKKATRSLIHYENTAADYTIFSSRTLLSYPHTHRRCREGGQDSGGDFHEVKGR